jgi:hypothetical protein
MLSEELGVPIFEEEGRDAVNLLPIWFNSPFYFV